MAQSGTDDSNAPDGLSQETLDRAAALAKAMKGKSEDELVHLIMENLLTGAKSASSNLSEVTENRTDTTSGLPVVLHEDVSREPIPESKCQSLETGFNDTTDFVSPVVPIDSAIVVLDDSFSSGCDSCEKMKNGKEMEEQNLDKIQGDQSTELVAEQTKSHFGFKPEIPRRSDLEQEQVEKGIAGIHLENDSKENDSVQNKQDSLITDKTVQEQVTKDDQNDNFMQPLNTCDDKVTSSHEAGDDGHYRNSDGILNSNSDSFHLDDGPSVSVEPTLEINKVITAELQSKHTAARGLDGGFVSSSLSDSDDSKFAFSNKDKKTENIPPEQKGDILGFTTNTVKDVFPSIEIKSPNEGPSSLDTKNMKLSAMSDGEDMAPSTPSSGEGATESDDSSLPDAENEGIHHHSDKVGDSVVDPEVVRPVNVDINTPDPSKNKETDSKISSSETSQPNSLQTVSLKSKISYCTLYMYTYLGDLFGKMYQMQGL